MRSLLAAAGLFWIAAQSGNSASFPFVLAENDVMPRADHGYVYFTGVRRMSVIVDQPKLTVYSPEGTLAYEVQLNMPSGALRITSAAFDTDGTAVAGVFDNPGTPEGLAGLVIVRHNGKSQEFVSTENYVPEQISIAPDHTIWTLGILRSGPNSPQHPEYMLLRKLSATGKMVGEYLNSHTFPPSSKGQTIEGSGEGWPFVAATKDKVLVYHPATRELIELDFNGNIINKSILPKPILHLAVTSNGDLYTDDHSGLTSVSRLDRASTTWSPVNTGEHKGNLLGVNGDRLTLGMNGSDHYEVTEFQPPAAN